MKINRIFIYITLSLVLLLTACGSNTTATPASSISTPALDMVIAEGHLIPNKGIYLSFLGSGHVTEVLVHKGDRVTQGQVLARLGDREQVEAALAGAKAQEFAAQQASDLLSRTADLSHALAWQAYMAAQKTRASAQLAWDRLDLTTIQVDIDNAQADVTNRRKDLDAAQADFNKYSDLPSGDGTRLSSEQNLRTAQINYDLAVQRAEDLTSRRDAVEAALDAALAAEADANRTFQNTQAGPETDRWVLAQAQLDAAKAQVAAAQSGLDAYDLKAPFAGIVADVNISEFQMVGPQTWAVALADATRWYVDTSDLSEMDVVKVSVGQVVQVTADALPGVTMSGTVESISSAPLFQGGDVLYTVHILLADPDPRLLWGMTMEVTFSP